MLTIGDLNQDDIVCDYLLGTGIVNSITEHDGVFVIFEGRTGRYQVSPKQLRHGTWEQNFGNLPVIKPKRKVNKWVNLYLDGGGYSRFYMYSSEEVAQKAAWKQRAIAVAVPIEVDEEC